MLHFCYEHCGMYLHSNIWIYFYLFINYLKSVHSVNGVCTLCARFISSYFFIRKVWLLLRFISILNQIVYIIMTIFNVFCVLIHFFLRYFLFYGLIQLLFVCFVLHTLLNYSAKFLFHLNSILILYLPIFLLLDCFLFTFSFNSITILLKC